MPNAMPSAVPTRAVVAGPRDLRAEVLGPRDPLLDVLDAWEPHDAVP